MQKDYISWERIKQLSDEISAKIAQENPDLSQVTLVAVSRGGLVPAQVIAYKLDIRDIRVIKLISYDNNNTRGETKDISTDVIPNHEHVYFIDDLADSGATVKYLRTRYPNARQCTLLTKDCCTNKPDITAATIDGTTWLVFPWD